MKLITTLYYHRVTEQAEENKMTASNLGIIFGPTLVKPRQTDAEVSLSSLVDYPYQALMVELLVRHFQTVFDVTLLPGNDITATGQASPRLTPQEKVQRLSRYSTSMMDIKEVRRDLRVWPACTVLASWNNGRTLSSCNNRMFSCSHCSSLPFLCSRGCNFVWLVINL